MELKKIFMVFFTIIVCVALVVASMYVYLHFTNKQDQKIKTLVYDPIISKDDFPRIEGIYLTAPLIDAFKENFVGEVDEKTVYVENETEGYKDIVGNRADIFIGLLPTDEEKKIATSEGVSLEMRQICNEGFVFVVNKNNKVDSLTVEQIQKIYSGEITNWNEVGGDDIEIKAFQREKNSINQKGMESLVMKKPDATQKVNISEDDYSLSNAVEEYDNSKGAIGYCYYKYAETAYSEDEVKMISINGIKPTEENIKNGKYPLRSGYYVVLRESASPDSNIRKIVDAMFSDRGKSVVKEAGYVTIE